jgi:hypothetical protein
MSSFICKNIFDTSIQNILLIDNSVINSDIFYHNANSNTFPIIYNSSSKSDDLLSILNNFPNIKTIGFVFHGSTDVQFDVQFIDNLSFFDPTNIDLLVSIVQKFNIHTLNFLGCNTLQYDSWKIIIVI